eukprot:CAMPEP_0194138768 /NCGR_PEP_ID=MMETSP0152-20130528/8514_1 /TAXON_ID=1049557 /ORGANISM="Thalassiothrix antarctica, Strain L6-D1" /LENGTH=523 /DNA_ID=CAMNT_0038836341 /DNA_START=750 /DNA_END=2318 /DNA_ORIENTATION=-
MLSERKSRFDLNDEGNLQLLLCTGNMGNAKPTVESMEAWIPSNGECSAVNALDNVPSMPHTYFDVIAIGMQEATWKEGNAVSFKSNEFLTEEDVFLSLDNQNLARFRGIISTILGEYYSELHAETRGQMRFLLWARNGVIDFIHDIKISGANTGVGNVLANKGGIVTSFNFNQTRISFLSAHLAAHEGETYYKTRCENIQKILEDSTNMFDLSSDNVEYIDVTVSSHHMFVMGDLNFRTLFHPDKGEKNDTTHEDNVERALNLINEQKYLHLYYYDELTRGLERGDLLFNFNTLPCNFPPTFKVERKEGFVYKKQRVPSYTDRILFKSSDGLGKYLKPLAYEPCVDFVTSDHKPIRAAFSIRSNKDIDPVHILGKHTVTISSMKCHNLRSSDINGKSDPYLMFLFESTDLITENKSIMDALYSSISRIIPSFLLRSDRRSWLQTHYIPKTLDPDWGEDTKLSFSLENCEIQPHQMVFVIAVDYDMIGSDDWLGIAAFNMKEMFTFANECEENKTQYIKRSLTW